MNAFSRRGRASTVRAGNDTAPKGRAGHANAPAQILRGANDNPRLGEACVTDAGARLPSPSITPEELTLLRPLIKALAERAANDLSATTLSSEADH